MCGVKREVRERKGETEGKKDRPRFSEHRGARMSKFVTRGTNRRFICSAWKVFWGLRCGVGGGCDRRVVHVMSPAVFLVVRKGHRMSLVY